VQGCRSIVFVKGICHSWHWEGEREEKERGDGGVVELEGCRSCRRGAGSWLPKVEWDRREREKGRDFLLRCHAWHDRQLFIIMHKDFTRRGMGAMQDDQDQVHDGEVKEVIGR
jgi:hypothetical protein